MPMILEPGELVAKRRLVKLLSEGGMGEVWIAVKIELDKPVVLKFILPQFAAQPQFRELFEREARTVARLDHPNIVRVFDFGRLAHSRGDILWFEQEYVRGEDLARLRQKHPRGFPLSLALFIIHEALKGLLFAHEYCAPDGTPQPIIHRDIKPHNILVAYEGSVHLADFGIAKMRKADNTPTISGLKGTLGYIAPEHVMGHPPDHRSDLFAMGLVFWEVLGGQRLFAADNDQAVLWKTSECIVPALAEHGVGVPPAVEAIVRRMLARDPNERYQSARQVIDDLRNAPGGRDAGSLELKAFLLPVAATSIPQMEAALAPSSPSQGTPLSGSTAFIDGARRTLSGPPRGEVAAHGTRPGNRKVLVVGGIAALALGGALVPILIHAGDSSPSPTTAPVAIHPSAHALPPDAGISPGAPNPMPTRALASIPDAPLELAIPPAAPDAGIRAAGTPPTMPPSVHVPSATPKRPTGHTGHRGTEAAPAQAPKPLTPTPPSERPSPAATPTDKEGTFKI